MAQGNPGPPGGGSNNTNRRAGRGGQPPVTPPTGFPTRHPAQTGLPFRTLNAGNPPTIREHTNRPTNLR